jgi:hypothetical protein
MTGKQVLRARTLKQSTIARSTAVVFAEDVPLSEDRHAPAPEMRRDEPRRDEVKPMEKAEKIPPAKKAERTAR